MSDAISSSARQHLEPLIFFVRGHRVILDADLARIYGVTTKRFNEAFKRNRQRFPADFAFQISPAEIRNLRSQIATSSPQSADSIKNNRTQIAVRSHGGRRHLPWAFTEHGSLMAANVLRSNQATQMSIFVIRTFVRLREQSAANAAILKRLAEIDRTLLQHDSALRDLYRKLQPLLAPPADPPRRTIGFLSDP